MGQLVTSQAMGEGHTFEITIPGPAGLYLLKVQSEKGDPMIRPVLKQ